MDETAAGAGAPETPADQAAPAVEDSSTQLERLNAQLAELNGLNLRLRADYDNFRKRAERERGEVYDLASMEAVRSLLPVLDDFERALQTKPSGDGPLNEYARGIELIWQRLLDSLAKLGLEPLDAVGKAFDPNLHHAVQREQREDCEDQTVLEQYQRGYNFKGKLLRAAMVKVAVKA